MEKKGRGDGRRNAPQKLTGSSHPPSLGVSLFSQQTCSEWAWLMNRLFTTTGFFFCFPFLLFSDPNVLISPLVSDWVRLKLHQGNNENITQVATETRFVGCFLLVIVSIRVTYLKQMTSWAQKPTIADKIHPSRIQLKVDIYTCSKNTVTVCINVLVLVTLLNYHHLYLLNAVILTQRIS